MAKKKKEEPIVDNETGSLKVKEQKEKQPTGNETKGNVTKVKETMTMKPKVVEETITKVDLNNPPEVKQEEKVEPESQETPALEEITEEGGEEEVTVEATTETVEEAIIESMETGKVLPENVQKLVDFMEETGGNMSDYVKLNKDYSTLDNQDLLQEYYTQTKPHLNAEEINFLMEDQFSFDEDVDDEKDIRRKKLALKSKLPTLLLNWKR